MLKRSALLTSFCSALSIVSHAHTQTIDFETLPGGAATTDNMQISTQYEADFGVRFSLVDPITGFRTGFPYIAKVGSPVTAFVSCQGDDTPDSGLGTGSTFLTDDGILGNSANLLIEYIFPVQHASGIILDVDARSSEPGAVEGWLIEAFSSSGELLEFIQIFAPLGPDEPGCEGFNGEGDGSARGFSFSRLNADISFIEFSYIGNAKLGSVGLAFDNFSPASPVEELVVELTFNIISNEYCEGVAVNLIPEISGGFFGRTTRWESRPSPDDPWMENTSIIGGVDDFIHPSTGEEFRIVVNDGHTEVASDPISFDFDGRSFTLRTSDTDIEDADLFQIDDTLMEDVWGNDPTSFDNDDIETVSEGVHVVPMLTANGAHLAVIFNTTGGSTPGTVTTEIISLNWEPELIFVDDPDDPMYNDTYTEEDLGPGMKRFTLDQTWAGDKTDGFIIGPMTDAGSCSITFTESSGLSAGLCFNGDGAPIPFNFTDGMVLDFSNTCSASCPADLTDDGAYDFFVSAFLIAFGNQDPIADFQPDGSYDFFDVSAFLTAFSAGCQ
jgi:hypothetical protein